ncbi:MAG: hypothetical protein ACREN6_12975 [Gemmatimonadaceae bacterium]
MHAAHAAHAALLLALPPAMMLVAAPRQASAQGSYEIEVYSTEIAPVKSLLVELHSNYTFRGSDLTTTGSHAPVIDDEWVALARRDLSASVNCSTPFFQQTAPSRASLSVHDLTGAGCATTLPSNSYATHETVEAVTGLTSWSEIGAYLFTSEQNAPLARAVGASVRYKVRAPLVWHWPVNIALSTELEYDDPRFSADRWTWELRPVIDKALGRWYVSLNPTLERTLEGAGVVNGLQFSPSAKTDFDFTDRISGGVEYYGAYGKIGGFAPAQSRLQQCFGVVDLHVSPKWEINAGLGAGMTPATSHLVGKVILGRRF